MFPSIPILSLKTILESVELNFKVNTNDQLNSDMRMWNQNYSNIFLH